MYKKFFMGIAAMAALTLVSCSSDDLNSLSDNSSKNEAISFDGYLGRSAVAVNGTRGSELKIDDLKKPTEGFGVFGNYTATDVTTITYGENLFKNQKVTYSTDDTKWTYEPVKYWSTQGHIDFLAYAPYVKGTKLTDSKINFEVVNTVADQKDLLWANAKNQKKINNPVKFTFNHALAKIGYAVKKGVTDDNVTITLNKITLAGSETDPKVGAFHTTGTIDLSKDLTNTENQTALWTDCSGEQSFTWSSGFPNVTSSSFSAGSDYLFVIPQNFSTGKLYVIVDYTISYNDGVTAAMKSTVSSQIVKNFEQGKAYKINLTIGLTKIDFDVTDVNVWQEDVNNNIGIDSWN